MNTKVVDFVPQVERQNWLEIARSLAPEFGMRAADYDDSGDFVAENYRDLGEHERLHRACIRHAHPSGHGERLKIPTG